MTLNDIPHFRDVRQVREGAFGGSGTAARHRFFLGPQAALGWTRQKSSGLIMNPFETKW